MKLRVKTNVPIPHYVGIGSDQKIFNPDCEIEDKRAEDLLKSHPHVFEKAEGKVDLKTYTMKTAFVRRTIEELYKTFTIDQQRRVIEFAELVAANAKLFVIDASAWTSEQVSTFTSLLSEVTKDSVTQKKK